MSKSKLCAFDLPFVNTKSFLFRNNFDIYQKQTYDQYQETRPSNDGVFNALDEVLQLKHQRTLCRYQLELLQIPCRTERRNL